MDTVLTIFLSATGGVLITALASFLNTYSNNKHSFKIMKEKDKYEDLKYKNQILYKYLEELERKYLLGTSHDMMETLQNALEIRNGIRMICNLSIPLLSDTVSKRLDSLNEDEREKCNRVFDKYIKDGSLNVENDKMVAWTGALNLFRDELLQAIIDELKSLRDSRLG